MAITMVGFCTYVMRMDADRVARLFRTSMVTASMHAGSLACLHTHMHQLTMCPASTRCVQQTPTSSRTYHCPISIASKKSGYGWEKP
jgi:hypothetical protein